MAGATDTPIGSLHRRDLSTVLKLKEAPTAPPQRHEAVDALQSALELAGQLPAGPERDRREVRIRTKLGPALVATLGWREPEVQDNYERGLQLAATLPERFILRYGLACLSEETPNARSADDHRVIASRLAEGQRERAAALLERHWRDAMERVLATLAG